MKRIIITIFFALFSMVASARDRVEVPKTLKLFLGGSIWGPTYSVELQDGKLHYKAREGQGNETTAVVVPTAAQWTSFRKALDECDVWSWRRTRSTQLDTRSWKVTISYKGKKLDRSGDGKPPGREGEFDRFQKAVRSLLGGKNFE